MQYTGNNIFFYCKKKLFSLSHLCASIDQHQKSKSINKFNLIFFLSNKQPLFLSSTLDLSKKKKNSRSNVRTFELLTPHPPTQIFDNFKKLFFRNYFLNTRTAVVHICYLQKTGSIEAIFDEFWFGAATRNMGKRDHKNIDRTSSTKTRKSKLLLSINYTYTTTIDQFATASFASYWRTTP